MANLLDLTNYLDQLPAKLEANQAELRIVADEQVDRIRSRTASGIGVDGTSFTGYQPKTKKTGTVDLRNSGNMLDSIFVEATDSEARISFSDPKAAELAGFFQNGTRKMAQRDFFGISISDREAILGTLRAAIFNRVNHG